MVGGKPFGLIPFAFIDADHFPGLTRYAVIAEKIGRVGEDHIKNIGTGAAQQFQRVALIQAQAAK